ncbi:MAG: ABC transporter permease subunit [Phycisphaerales bacterium]|nr:ABC transporter permease subunit [Phycisphaerales bacterium]
MTSLLEGRQAIPASRRNRTNRRFLWVALCVTSLSVLALSVLLVTVLFQGAKHLFGAEVAVVPDTTHLVSAELDERGQSVQLVTREPRTQHLELLERAPEGATVRVDGADVLVVAPDGAELRAGTRTDVTSAALTPNRHAVRIEYSELVTHEVGLPSERSLDGASIETDAQTGRVAVRYTNGSTQIVGQRGGTLARTHVVGSPNLKAAKDFLTTPPSMTPTNAGFNAPLLGSIWILVVCALSALPLGIGAAIMLEEFRPRRRGPTHWVHRIVQTNVRNLAGVPSIVYGLIGLTVFCRMFGLFGSALQYAPYQRFELTDGRTILGQLVATEEEVYHLDSELLGHVKLERSSLGEVTQWPIKDEPIECHGTVELNDEYLFVVRAPELGEITIDSWAIEHAELADGGPFSPREVDLTFSMGGQGRYVIETPDAGRMYVARDLVRDTVRDIDTVPIREHIYRMGDGRVLRGELMKLNDGELSIRRAIGEDVTTFNIKDVALRPDGKPDYRNRTMLMLGDEDSSFHVHFPMGASVLAGGLTLMLVILPIIIIATQEALRAVPDSLRSGALALGATPWQMVWGMTLPNAVPGIMTGAILAMSRAIGEAAPILVVGGTIFITFLPDNLMSGFAAMPLQIYMWTNQPDPEFKKVAASGILVLLTVLLLFNASAVFIRQKLQRPLT